MSAIYSLALFAKAGPEPFYIYELVTYKLCFLNHFFSLFKTLAHKLIIKKNEVFPQKNTERFLPSSVCLGWDRARQDPFLFLHIDKRSKQDICIH